MLHSRNFYPPANTKGTKMPILNENQMKGPSKKPQPPKPNNNKNELKELLKAPPNDFRDVGIFPSSEDLFGPGPSNFAADQFLRKNILAVPYPNVDTYLDIQFRLIRRDFVLTLRSTIGEFCKGTKQEPDITPDNKLPFYRNVKFTNQSFLSDGRVADRTVAWRTYTISFELPGPVDWENEKRLVYGSLICLWNAKFKIVILGTVSNSDILLLEKRMIVVSLHQPLPSQKNWQSLVYTMLECPAFYEPYRAVMEAYQSFDEKTFPLKQFILGWMKTPEFPDYLRKSKAVKNYRVQLANGHYKEMPNVLNFGFWPSAEELGLNAVQRNALFAALTRKVALIQGPPGTGKSFLGRKIISTLLDNQALWYDDGNFLEDNKELISSIVPKKMKEFWHSYGDQWKDNRRPILVICLTNMALDQFLEGILKRTNRIIRVGGQSKSAALEPYQLSVIKQSIMERSKDYDETNFTYYTKQMKELRKLYAELSEKIFVETGGNNEPRKYLKEQLEELIAQHNHVKTAADVALCRNADVIGMTTTGAARRRRFLNALKPKIVVVEEAAQVLEAHIVSSLTTSCEHLIMIGDHLQLRPTCHVHELAFKYHLDVSLFERLARSGFPSVTLQVQHRMQPEVARLIVPVVYEKLQNHPSVLKYPPVPSTRHSVYLIDHKEPEEREPGGSSYLNKHEATLALRLAHFLIDQGVQQEKITILAAYAAQTRTMKRHRAESYTLRSLDKVLVTTIDNYQGEENDIIILSLVRSNQNKSTGFLSTPNRVNVALSRAKHGLFILANMELLCHANNALWVHVKKTMQQFGQMGNCLHLRCDRHPEEEGKVISVKTASDFPLGGLVCRYSCGFTLECGHPCKLPCRNECQHNSAFCEAKSDVKLPCGHSTNQNCSGKKDHVPSSKCSSKRCDKKLKCGHACPLPCSESCEQATCRVEVELSREFFPRECGHVLKGPCFLNVQDGLLTPEGKQLNKCNQPCVKRLQCGHLCKLKCHEECNSVRCLAVVSYTFQKNGPAITGPCYIATSKLLSVMQSKRSASTLECDHDSAGKKSDGEFNKLCLEPCNRRLYCGHPCKLKCYEKCQSVDCVAAINYKFRKDGPPITGPCYIAKKELLELMKSERCPLTLECGHSCTGKKLDCEFNKSHAVCLEPCGKQLKCGHSCNLKCNEDCIMAKCQVVVETDQLRSCSHPFKLPCHVKCGGKKVEKMIACVVPCEEILDCGHKCTGTCGDCSDGLHKSCIEPCREVLICGHPCQAECGRACPPCSQPCRLRCIHRVCDKNCSEPCTLCLEPCEKSCPHQESNHKCYEYSNTTLCSMPCPKRLLCGHPCSGLCGELCPSFCVVCNCNKVKDPTARYVCLPECGHSVPVDEMDDCLLTNLNNNGQKTRHPFQVPKCPQCDTILYIARGRYADDVKSFYEQLSVAREWLNHSNTIELEDRVRQLLDCFTLGSREKSKETAQRLLNGKSDKDKWMIYQKLYYGAFSGLFEADVRQVFDYVKDGQTRQGKLNQSLADKELMNCHKAVQDAFLRKAEALEYLPIDLIDKASVIWKKLDWQRQFRTLETTNPGKELKDKIRVLIDAKKVDEKLAEKVLNEAFALFKITPADKDLDDQQLKIEFKRPVSFSSRSNWIKCRVCEAAYTSTDDDSCPNVDCQRVDK